MRLYDALVDKLFGDSLAFPNIRTLELPSPDELDVRGKYDQVINHLRAAFEGRSLTQIYMELGVLKGHSRGDIAAPKQPPSVKRLHTSLRRTSRAIVAAIDSLTDEQRAEIRAIADQLRSSLTTPTK